jgi:2-oxoglutarate ferredoxin oxidoreductase subunit beta
MSQEAPPTSIRRQPESDHPMADLLRIDRFPHVWCPTCGLGTVVNCFASAILKTPELSPDHIGVVSGIGCTGRGAGYLRLDSWHTTHGRALPFATGLVLSRPDMKFVVFSGDGDIVSIGGNHLIHAARRNMDMVVICVNNFIYAMTGGQTAPTTPLHARSSTSPFGNSDTPFNLPYLAASCGATYVARWTALHVRRLQKSISEALMKKGFSFIEVIAPCSTLYARLNRLGSGLDLMRFYHDNSEINHNADLKELDINFKGKIVCGRFVNIERPTYRDRYDEENHLILGNKFVSYQIPEHPHRKDNGKNGKEGGK